MKKIILKLLPFGFLILAGFAAKSYADSYDSMAIELSESASELKSPKIAVVPFSYSGTNFVDDGGGTVVSDRLTTKLVKTKKFKVIDRESLQKILAEQKLQTSGVVDPETAKKIGKVLGVEAIITGSLTNISGGMVEVNAKLIRTETAEIINVSSAKVEKDWLTNQQAEQPQQEEAYQQPVQKATPYRRIPSDTYFDIFLGLTTSNQADITLKNNSYFNSGNIGVYFTSLKPSNQLINKATFNGASFNNTQVPIGLRFAGFGKDGYVGGAFDIMYFSQSMSKGSVSSTFQTYNYGTLNSQYPNSSDSYLSVSTFLMDFDLLVRYPDKHFQPYVGIGIGLSLDGIQSSLINGNQGQGFTDFAPGIALNYLIGLRYMFNNDIGAFIESRTITNYFTFTRDIPGETDSMTMTNTFTLVGVIFKFKE